MGAEVLGEIYATQGGLLNAQTEELQPIILNYLQNVEKAGREIVLNKGISEETQQQLAQNFVPDEIYIQHANLFFDSQIAKL
jgi:hypothetical protein